MATTTIPPRSEVPIKYKWNAESVFENVEAWDAGFNSVVASLPDVAKFQGRLADSPDTLADALQAFEDLYLLNAKVLIYAWCDSKCDNTDQNAADRLGRANGLLGQVLATTAFLEPELIAIGERKLRRWIEDEPRLAVYEHYVDGLFHRQAHARSAEVEELLSLLYEPFEAVAGTADMLANVDFKFPPATTEDDTQVEVTGSSLQRILGESEREARRTAWEGYFDTYLAYRNTLASNLIAFYKQHVFSMRARRYESTLEAALFVHNIPTKVFHGTIETFKRNLSIWHRYWRIRTKALGVDALHPYDLWAPLATDRPTVTYEQAVDWICEGFAPMGQEYVNVVRHGCLEDRWVDVYPNQGKMAGGVSRGYKGMKPFILMNFNDDFVGLSTLAHELGHSMHGYLTWRNQPEFYCEYSMLAAEVASNFHQAIVRAYLLENNPDPAFQFAVVEEAMFFFHRYYFVMPILSQWELAVHQRVERGEGVNADVMNNLMADLFEEGYGGEMYVDRDRVGIAWAEHIHIYLNYYAFQFTTGIAGGHALAKRVLSGEEGAVDRVLDFLKAGGSRYPVELLQQAGVDLSRPDAVEETFGILSGMVDRLENLIG